MDKSLLKRAALQSMALMIAVITISFALKNYQIVTMSASSPFNNDPSSTKDSLDGENNQPEQSNPASDNPIDDIDYDKPITNVTEMKSRIDQSILQKLSDNFIVIKKPLGKDMTLKIEDLYVKQSIQLDLSGIEDSGLTSDMIMRVRGNDFFVGDPFFTETTDIVVDEDGISKEVVTKNYGKDISHGITILPIAGKQRISSTAKAFIALDTVYAYSVYEDNHYYYIDLRKPSDVYDKILVIDAGHGGKDAGAISKDGNYYEKNINLAILLQLKELLDQENIKVYYTRTGDDQVYLKPRVNLANAVDCDYFISIHCNGNKVTSPNGTEVLYARNEFKGIKAYDLANLFLKEITKTIILKDCGVVEKNPEDIFIMNKAKVPMILIEVGYMTNKNDINYLSKPANQKAVALGIYNGILNAYQKLPVTEEGDQ